MIISGYAAGANLGKFCHVGLVEAPMGTTLREIIYDIGGGIPDGKAFKPSRKAALLVKGYRLNIWIPH